ncbi:hypothetical protein ONE63_004044 [Megalurothrips usitatus]|uniref:G-protein coupled receptors family 1 profile domain-containing protein n=1 Tax=Megalurothrips usitatus TaxID=439358 RepID=A0AAV7X7H2_9NEOP|nr:hypothetical protein ONE63_004044 [Megalurothrips usitatus]
MVTITQFNSTRPSPAPPGSTLAPPPSPPTTTASTVTPSLATALPPSHPPTAASVLALALSRSTAPAVSAADAGQRRGSEAAGPAGPLEPVPRASPAPLTSALQPAAAPVPRPAPRTPAAVSAPPPAPTVRGPGAASHAPTPSSRPSSTTPPVTPWPAAASAQWNTPEVEDRLEQLKKEIEGSGTVEVIGILEVDTEAGRPAPWPSTRGPTEPVSTGTPLRVVEELVIVEDAADRFVLEGLELGNDSQPNNQTNCTNDYCVSDDDYISMMEDYLFPTKLEWVLITMHGVVFVSGLVGNALVCVAVYRNHTMRTVTNYFIVNLAVADFLVILLCLPPTVMWDVTETWFMGTALCKIVLYFQVSHAFSFDWCFIQFGLHFSGSPLTTSLEHKVVEAESNIAV